MDENNKNPNQQKLTQPTNQPDNLVSQSGNQVAQIKSIYPEASRDINDDKAINAEQAFALHMMEKKAQESNKLVCMRVKAVIVIAVLLIISSIFVITSSLDSEYSGIIISISLIQLVMSLGLLVSRDVSTVGIILKLFLVFQLVGVGMSFSNPISIFINGLGLLLLIYAYFSVKSLNY